MKKTNNWYIVALLAGLLVAGCGDQAGSGGSGSGSLSGTGVDPDPSTQPTVGIPDQASMSLSIEQRNLNCWLVDGVTTGLTIRLADQLNNNNTIPDGTIVYFAAEGGSITDRCETAGGACSVTFTCQANRPADGRISILAWTLGTESFDDDNGNGFFDSGDTLIAAADVGEPFIDKNENGIRDSGEEFVNYPNPGLSTGGTYDVADGLYSGVNCAFPGMCATNQSVFIYRSGIICSSDGTNTPRIIHVVDSGTDYQQYAGATPVVLAGTGTIFYFLITDVNGNMLPKGAKITFDASVGDIQGASSYTVPNGCPPAAAAAGPWPYSVGAMIYPVLIVADPMNTEDGYLEVKVDIDGVAYSLFPSLAISDP